MKKIASVVLVAMILVVSVSAMAAGKGLTAEEAKQAALKFTGVNEEEAVFTKLQLDWDDGRQVYEIEFHVGATEYEMDVDVRTGRITDFSKESFDWDDDWDDLFDWD